MRGEILGREIDHDAEILPYVFTATWEERRFDAFGQHDVDVNSFSEHVVTVNAAGIVVDSCYFPIADSVPGPRQLQLYEEPSHVAPFDVDADSDLTPAIWCL